MKEKQGILQSFVTEMRNIFGKKEKAEDWSLNSAV